MRRRLVGQVMVLNPKLTGQNSTHSQHSVAPHHHHSQCRASSVERRRWSSSSVCSATFVCAGRSSRLLPRLARPNGLLPLPIHSAPPSKPSTTQSDRPTHRPYIFTALPEALRAPLLYACFRHIVNCCPRPRPRPHPRPRPQRRPGSIYILNFRPHQQAHPPARTSSVDPAVAGQR